MNNKNMKPIKEVNGWYATIDGKIYSSKINKILKGRILKSGYVQVGTNISKKKVKLYRVHKLICRAFHGDPPNENYTVDHINFIKTDNRPENLRWLTIHDNINYSVVNNRRLRKLTPDQIRSIRNEYVAWDRTKSASVLARKYNVHRSYILSIIKNTYVKYIQ